MPGSRWLGRVRSQYGLIILDAFSSDAIPIHLLTREAMELYLSRLAPGGVIALHISNLHLSLSPVLGRVAQESGARRRSGSVSRRRPGRWRSASSRRNGWSSRASARDLGGLTTDARWRPPVVAPSTPLWTDDFSNILSVLRH